MREKVGKSRNTVFFPMIWGSGGSKSRLAKAAGAEPAGQRRKIARRCGAKHISKSKCTKHTRCGPLLAVEMSKKCTPLWREAHFQVKMYKAHHSRTTFGSWDVQKVHAVVARSTFPSQNVQNTPGPDHFWKLRCPKSVRCCGAKHISKWKCTNHTRCGPLLEVEMSKKCTPLWREAHFQIKMYKTHQLRTTFGSWDVEKVHAVVERSTFPSENVQKHTMVGPLLEVQISKKCTPLWHEAHFQVKMCKTHQVRTTFGGSDVEKVHAVVARSTFRSENVQNTRGSDHFWRFRCRFTSLHYITLHYTTFHYTSLHYTTLHSDTLQLQLHNYTPLQYTPLH